MPSPSTSRSPTVTTSPVYDRIGRQYIANRRADPRWEAIVAAQLGDAQRIVNVGAGTGSYEPPDRSVVAIEPSTVMLGQRAPDAAPAVRAVAADLPVVAGWADVVMAVLTVHHWADWERGLADLCRVAERRMVCCIDFEIHSQFWLLREYLPEVLEHTLRCAPTAAVIADAIGATTSIDMPVYRDLQDGVLGAYWCRPEQYLDHQVRANNSGTALAHPETTALGIARLEADLASGAWHERHAELLARDSIDMGYRLLVAG
jgi:SAM-dependent methyltransferase